MAGTGPQPLLVELFVEELPPKTLKKLGAAFADGLASGLVSEGLAAVGAQVTPFATPRRLAVRIDAVLAQAPDRAVSIKLMPASVGLDAEGKPTPALLKKLAAVGADASAATGLQRRLDGKSETLFLDQVGAGASLAEGLQRALAQTLAQLPIAKVMQYQLADGWTSVSFVRPAHGLVALHGSDVVPVRALGLESGRTTRGHRFEATRTPVTLRAAESYEQQLRDEGAVIASFDGRRAEIVRQLLAASSALSLQPVDDDALLDEVTALVERPNVVTCKFDEEFLAVPPECLVLTMKANQKYFPLRRADGALTSRFLVVSNVTPADPARVIEGNERVVRPRLADAKFFFDQDRKRSLESRVPALDKVVYHGKLGSLGDRVRRVRVIAQVLGEMLAGDALAIEAGRAALLAKADLVTDMVGEFPELQGVMGRYYARSDGESETLALAIEDHYRPRFAGDDLPRNEVGVVLALADKLETLVGMFGIGEFPSGDRDPFALRRHALGVIRLLMGPAGQLTLDAVVDAAIATPEWSVSFKTALPDRTGAVTPLRERVLSFVEDRLRVVLLDAGNTPNDVAAVVDAEFWRLSQVPRRLEAVRIFSELPEAPALAAANKRVSNLLRKSEIGTKTVVRPDLLVETAERELYAVLSGISAQADAAFDAGDYTSSLRTLAALKVPVDAFFEAVMVNVDDADLRANRLALLGDLRHAMSRVADLSKLAG